MITVTREAPVKARKESTTIEASKLEALRQKINNEDYLCEAIQRIALILSNELLDIPQGGGYYERQWKGRK
jgi:hypothetical protein